MRRRENSIPYSSMSLLRIGKHLYPSFKIGDFNKPKGTYCYNLLPLYADLFSYAEKVIAVCAEKKRHRVGKCLTIGRKIKAFKIKDLYR